MLLKNKNYLRRNNVLSNLILFIASIACILPLFLVISISLSNMNDIIKYGYMLIPKNINFSAYIYLFKDSRMIFDAYKVTIFVTIVGTISSVFLMSLIAFPLSRKDFRLKGIFSFIVFFTMLFNGGLVPWYILISRYLNLSDTIWVLILPYLISPWYILLLRTFFKNIPFEIIEAAKIDGSSEFRVFVEIILPMSKAALATIALLVAYRYWNDWYLGMLFIQKQNLRPLQYLIQSIMSNMAELEKNFQLLSKMLSGNIQDFPREPVRMAMAVIAAGPILIIFPFFQKYFIKGMTVGAIKG